MYEFKFFAFGLKDLLLYLLQLVQALRYEIKVEKMLNNNKSITEKELINEPENEEQGLISNPSIDDSLSEFCPFELSEAKMCFYYRLHRTTGFLCLI